MVRLRDGTYFPETSNITHVMSIIPKKDCEVLTHLYNWSDTNDLGIEIDIIDEENYRVSGPVNNMLLFIYNQILKLDYTIDKIMIDKSLDAIVQKYFKKVW